MKKEIRKERRIPHPPEAVWRALTEPALIARWLLAGDFDAREGGAYCLRAQGADQVKGRIVVADPPRRLSYTWVCPCDSPDETLVEWTLEPEDGGTRLILLHSGFEKLPAQTLMDHFKGTDETWERCLDELASVAGGS